MTNTNSYLRKLVVSNPLGEPTYRLVIQTLRLPQGSRGLDAGSVHAPLSDEIRNAMMALLEMRWGDVQAELSHKDWIEFPRLCLPESPDFILNNPDYYAFFTYSLFRGRVTR